MKDLSDIRECTKHSSHIDIDLQEQNVLILGLGLPLAFVYELTAAMNLRKERGAAL